MCLEEIFKQSKSREAILGEIATFLENEYGIKAYFCKIAGKRWAFLNGNKNVDIPRHRIRLDNDTGLIVESLENIDDEKWKIILNTVTANIELKRNNYDIYT